MPRSTPYREPSSEALDLAAGTPGPRRLDALFVAAMVLTFTIPPLSQAIIDLRLGRLPSLPSSSSGGQLSGAVRPFSDTSVRRSWLDELGSDGWAPMVNAALDRGSSSTVVGTSGWLFYRQGLQFVAGRDLSDGPRRGGIGTHPSTVHDVIVDFHRQLSARGIRLIVVPIPTKATVYPERLSSRLAAPSTAAEAPNDPGVAKLLAQLADSNVEVIDPLPALLAAKRDGDDIFLASDTHWSWVGMRRVVELVAEQLPLRPVPRQLFDSRRVVFEADGDLSRMLARPTGSQPALRFEATQIVPALGGSQPIWTNSTNVLIGDSSLLVFSEPSLGLGRRAGFAEQLAWRLGRPVDRLAIPAGGATRVRQLLALEPERLARAETVIWIFTQRDLRFATDGWHDVQLPTSSDAGDKASPAYSGSVAARVVAVSRPPRPTDYADCLMIVRYQTLEQATGAPGRTIDVAHLGWRDFTPTPAARLVPGDIVDLTLTDLPADRQLDRSCWVDDVGLTTYPRWATTHAVR